MTETERTNEWVWISWAVLSVGIVAAALTNHHGPPRSGFWCGVGAAWCAWLIFRALIACIRLGRTSSGGEA